MAQTVSEQTDQVDPVAELTKTRRLGGRIITPHDDEYPQALSTIHDPPLALYIRGRLEKSDHRAIATADRLSYQLAQTGFTVVSGLARGIDTAGHAGALKARGRTIAVLGSALDRLYPPENSDLADAISKQGAILSEYPLGREPDRTTFPYRNRIVSGLSMGILVVEAQRKSGALIPADMALEQGRSVFAVPGRIDSPSSKGTHQLIKNGARLVEDIEDILAEFEFLHASESAPAQQTEQRELFLNLSDDEAAVVQALGEG